MAFRPARGGPIDVQGIPGQNYFYASQGEARIAALRQARRRGPGHSIVHHPSPRRGQPHYHILTPGGQRVPGHFFYGRRMPRRELRDRPNREYKAELEALLEQLQPPRQHNQHPRGVVPGRNRCASSFGVRQGKHVVEAAPEALLERDSPSVRFSGEAMSARARGRPRPPRGADVVTLYHYSPQVIRTAINPNSFWTDFGSRNRNDVARITGRNPADLNYRYTLRLLRTERDRLFRNRATKMVPGLPAADEYVSRASIPISWFQSVHML
ncbi:MAG TPA: hypothetical protein VFS21_13415 [Roseiflexaceae bacterium]|nr:hypothetical protein [Roseiflexaceae bacterium]